MRYYRVRTIPSARKVVRAVPTVDGVNIELVGSCGSIRTHRPTAEERAVFCLRTGQYSDGWGESFEQREIDVGDGKLTTSISGRITIFELKRDVCGCDRVQKTC